MVTAQATATALPTATQVAAAEAMVADTEEEVVAVVTRCLILELD